MIGIYKILCTVTNEFYIGSSINIASRKAGHLYNLRNNKHTNPILQAKYNKYGESNFIFSLLEIPSAKLKSFFKIKSTPRIIKSTTDFGV